MTTADANFTLTILNREERRFAVEIPEEAAPMVLNDEGEEERDYGNADWPTDEAIIAEAARQFGCEVIDIDLSGPGDNNTEAIYTAELAVKCIYCERMVSFWPEVPASNDEEAWEELATEHDTDCEWIATRAHTRDAA